MVALSLGSTSQITKDWRPGWCKCRVGPVDQPPIRVSAVAWPEVLHLVSGGAAFASVVTRPFKSRVSSLPCVQYESLAGPPEGEVEEEDSTWEGSLRPDPSPLSREGARRSLLELDSKSLRPVRPPRLEGCLCWLRATGTT